MSVGLVTARMSEVMNLQRESGAGVEVRPGLESLEARRLLTSYVVDTTVDESDGDYSAGDLSLREAIELANADAAEDTITFSTVAFDGGGTIVLGSELDVAGDLQINGRPGIRLDTEGLRVFDVATGVSLSISELEIRGASSSDADGAAIRVGANGSLALNQVAIAGSSDQRGGGIFAESGSHLELKRSEVTGTFANVAGGAIYTLGESLHIEGTRIGYVYSNDGLTAIYAKNLNTVHIQESVIAFAASGLIASDITGLTIVNTSFYGGYTAYDGGGISAKNISQMVMVNSTVSNHSTSGSGGGIFFDNTNATLINSTITGNDASYGGGIALDGSSTITLVNTIIAGNSASSDEDIQGTVLGENNLIGDASSSGGLVDGVDGNIIGDGGTGVILIDMILDTDIKKDVNGQLIHYLLDSIAVNAGDSALLPLDTLDLDGDLDLIEQLPLDQIGRTRIADAGVDIGAIEYGNYIPADLNLNGGLVYDDANVGDFVGVFSVVDGNPEDTHTYRLIDNANGRFALSIDGRLSVLDASLFDVFKAAVHQIGVEVTDNHGEAYTEYFDVEVRLGGVAPHDIVLVASGVPEDTPQGTVVGTVTVSDVDPSPPDSHSFELSSGYFKLDNLTGVLTLEGKRSIDYERSRRIPIDVRVVDGGFRAYSKRLYVDVLDVNEPPTSISISGNEVDENSDGGTYIGTLTAVDPDNKDTHTFELLEDAGGRFQVIDDKLYVLDGGLLDFETDTSHVIQVKATDRGNETVVSSLIIDVRDVFETELIVSTLEDESDGDFSRGDLSLREAIEIANANALRYTVTFDSGVFEGGQTIVLGGAYIEIVEDVEILADKELGVTVSGGGLGPVFLVRDSDVVLSGLRIVDGVDLGGVHVHNGFLSIYDCEIRNNSSYDGGGIDVYRSRLDVFNSVISDNEATAYDGGGIGSSGSSEINIYSSVLENNVASNGGGGVAAAIDDVLVIEDSLVRNNHASYGGGIYCESLFLSGSKIVGNTTINGGGGGGIFVDDYLVVTSSEISYNYAHFGGGGITAASYIIQFEIIGSLINHNVSGRYGGGISIDAGRSWEDGRKFVRNSTISSNVSEAGGGGLYVRDVEIEVLNSSVVLNSSGVYIEEDGFLSASNTIVSGNAGGDIEGVVAQGRNVLIGDAGTSGGLVDGVDGNIVGVDGVGIRDINTILDVSLRDNGGPTLTHNLAFDSPALNAGDKSLLPVDEYDQDSDGDFLEALPLDQRGYLRVANGQVDIGAVEVEKFLLLDGHQVSENAPAGTPVGQVSVWDAEIGRLPGWEYTIWGQSPFLIDPSTGEVTVSGASLLNHEFESTQLLTVQAIHASGQSMRQSFVIDVLDLNERPSDIGLYTRSVPEGAVFGSIIGNVWVEDEDAADNHTFRLKNYNDRFSIGVNDGQLTVTDGSLLDFESQSEITLEVEVQDAGGESLSKSFAIQLLDVNEAPASPVIDNNVVSSWLAVGTVVAKVSSVDPDADDVLTYSILRNDGGLFEIDSVTGELSLLKDIGLIESTFLIVRVTDQLGAFSDKRFNFSVEKASGELSRVNLPARGIQGVTFKGSVNAKLLNDSGRDWDDLSHMDLKLVARPTGGGADRVLATRDYKGKLQQGKSKSVSFNFSSSLPAGDYRILVIASYQAPGDPEAVTLIAAEDKSSNPQLLSVDSGAHTDLTTETELGSKLPASHPEGERLKVKLKVYVKNDGNVEMPAAVTSLHVFLEDSLGTRHGPPLFVNPNLKLSKMKPGQVKAVNVSFDMPADTALGDFHFAVDIDGLNLIDETNEAGTAESNNSSRSSETILIEESYLDLTTEIGDRKGVRTYSAGKAIKDSRSLRVGNQGNVVTAKSALANLRIEIYDALDQLVDTQLIENVKLGNLKPGKSKNVAARMSFDPLGVGDYRTVYTLEPVNFTDTDLSDNAFEQVFRVR